MMFSGSTLTISSRKEVRHRTVVIVTLVDAIFLLQKQKKLRNVTLYIVLA